MKHVRAAVADLAEGDRVLSGDTSRYLCRVLRLGEGDRFLAFDPMLRTEADATIMAASADAARVRIDAPRPAPVVAERELVLVYALAKGDKVDAVIRDATELGATRIIVTRTERSVAKVDADRSAKKGERWGRIAAEAARQCGRADPPILDGPADWPDALDRAARSTEARFCLDPRAAAPIGVPLEAAIAGGAAIAIAIGPEGGLSADEIEIAIGKGFVPVTLGRFVLRTETAPAAVLGAIRILSTR